MRIAIIANEFPLVSETFVINHVASLIDRGHEVSVFAFKSDAVACPHQIVSEYGMGHLVRQLDPSISDSNIVRALHRLELLLLDGWREPNITMRSLDPRIGERTAFTLALYAWTRAFEGNREFDIVHCHFGWTGIIGARLKKAMAFQGKLVVTFHGSDVNVTGAIGSSRQRKFLFETADWFTANTMFITNQAVSLGCPRERCSIWHMGVDLQLFKFRERQVADGEPIRILTVARLTEVKGIEYVIRALPFVKRSGKQIQYHVVGDGPLRRDLAQLAQDIGVGEQVFFHGNCSSESVRYHLDRAHLFVLASVTAQNNAREGQPVVLVEAQACGLPIIATTLAGIPETVLEGKSAYLVPERDVDALADRLNYLIANTNVWRDMGLAGRQYVEQEFALDRCTNVITSLYDQLVT